MSKKVEKPEPKRPRTGVKTHKITLSGSGRSRLTVVYSVQPPYGTSIVVMRVRPSGRSHYYIRGAVDEHATAAEAKDAAAYKVKAAIAQGWKLVERPAREAGFTIDSLPKP